MKGEREEKIETEREREREILRKFSVRHGVWDWSCG
jgi:hypothetical protein